MTLNFHDKDALITAATQKAGLGMPIAFLVGSPLSTKDGAGVPGVSEILDLAREEIRGQAPKRLPNFEESIRGKSSGEAYQAAMSWLNGNLLQDGVNRVVNAAVRRARKAGTDVDFPCDGSHCDWHIAPGTQQLAALICRDRERFPGPILTTNFDPLLSLAIEACGAKPRLRVIQADGGLGQDVRRTGETDVVHLHGFWRDSDTLHSPAQLTAPRPRLKDSLKEILRQKTLIVAAYGGWDDVFATALAEVAVDDAAQVNILWCFRETDTAKIARDYEKLFQRVLPAITRGRFVAYCGIDCHSIFGEIAAALPPAASPSAASGTSAAPLPVGWQEITPSFLAGLPPLTKDEIVRYFDGAVPTWRHAVSSAIPRREDATTLARNLAKATTAPRSMQLIRAAGGEGKSTLLLQVAADAACADGWSVLWRTSAREGIAPEQLATLDPARRWLIVADDADNIVPGLADSAGQLSQSGRGGIHFLLATRDADWKNAHGQQQAWSQWLDYSPDLTLRAISASDAKAVLAAWETAGPDGLRELATESDPAKRLAAFESAIRDASNQQAIQGEQRRPQDGSFFGGLLAVRFGQNGLQAHVRAFLERLKRVPIEGGKGTLFDALLYVAACHGTGIPGIDERVLADLVSVPREWVQSRVVRPLGEEAAAVHSAGHVLTRHSKVAAAVLVEAERTFETDLAEVWARLVRQTVQTGRGVRIGQTFSFVVHAGPRLQKALPPQLTEDRRKAIAIAAAKSAATHKSEWLGCVVDLGKTYRRADDADQASQVFRDNLAAANEKVDHHEVIRGYWYEWSVCEGERGTATEHALANAWLGGLSLSDHLNPTPITPEQAKLSCAGLGVAFGKLATPAPDCPYAKSRRAVACLGRLTNPDTKTAGYLARHDREGDKLKTPIPRNVREAIDWLTAGVVQAGRELADPFLKALVRPEQVSFKLLQHHLEGGERPRTARRENKPQPTQTAQKPIDTKPLRLPSPLENRVAADIERVLAKAWVPVPDNASEEERFKAACRNAANLISRLSPHTKQQVGAHFLTQKWLPLKARDPKTR